jgi:hypothetical protein
MPLGTTSKEQLFKALDEFATDIGETVETVAISVAAYMCLDSMRFTPPLAPGGGGGETKQAELTGVRAVARDINSLFVAANDRKRAPAAMLLMRMQSSAKMRDMGSFIKAHDEAKQVGLQLEVLVGNKIVQDGDSIRAYKKACNYFNRTNVKATEYGPIVITNLREVHDAAKRQSNGKTRLSRGTGDYRGKYLVESVSVLNAYIKERQLQVGRMKSGWWNLLTSLPVSKNKKGNPSLASKTVAGYVKRFPGSPSSFTKTTTKDGTDMVIANMNGDNDGMATKFGVPGIVYNQAIMRMEAYLRNEAIANIRKFNGG